MNRILLVFASVMIWWLPGLAGAQLGSDYPLVITPMPYQPLPITGGSAVTNVTMTDDFSGTDWGGAILNLPFPVQFYGTTYNTLHIYTDGYASFGAPHNEFSEAANNVVPNGAAPNKAVFLWHDDLELTAPLKTQVLGTGNGRQFVIEWKGIRWNTGMNLQMQLWLTENSPVIRVRYGPSFGDSAPGQSTISASMGLENATGTIGTAGPSIRGGVCNPGCVALDFPSGREYMYGATNEPDLAPSVVLGAWTAENDDTELRIPITTTIRNQGLQPAAGVAWNYYLSRGTSFNPADPRVEPAHLQLETIPPMSTVSFTDLRLYPMPPIGEYRVCVLLDPDGTVDDANRSNDTGCSSNPIIIGPDIVAEAIQFVGVSTAFPGDLVTVSYRIRNIGNKPSGSFVYDLMLSDQVVSTRAKSVYRGSIANLEPGELFQDTMQVRIGMHLPGDQFFPMLDVNTDRLVPEASLRNNQVFGPTAVTMLLPDVAPKTIVVGGDGCFFGRELPVSYQICNSGRGTASNFADALFLHDAALPSVNFELMKTVKAVPEFCAVDSDCRDLNQGVCIQEILGSQPSGFCHYGCVSQEDCGQGSQLSCLPDLDLGGQKSCQNAFLASQCRTIQKNVTIPTVDHTGAPLRENHDYMFTVVLDPNEKLNEGTSVDRIINNFVKSTKFRCRYPAPDLLAVSVRPGDHIAAGDTLAIHRKIENRGNERATAAYRYVLSTNDIGSDVDLRLPLVSTGGDGVVILGSNGTSDQTDLVSIPAHVVSREYHLGLVIDPSRTLHEQDKTNNTVMALGKVFVEPQAFRIRNQVLPEGRVGSSYDYQLVATGGTVASVWSAKGLPPFLTLSEAGHLHADQLMDDGVFVFEVSAASGATSATSTVVLSVTLPRGPLTLNTRVLPTGYTFSTSPYFAPLSISGGVPPYACSYQGMPNRFRLPADDSCTIIASDGLENAGDYRFQVTVTDARKTQVRGELQLAVRDSNGIDFKEHRFVHDGLIGEVFEECVESTANRHVGRDTEDSVIYSWTIDSAPAGIALGSRNPGSHPASTACLSGVPTECGSFMVRMRVETRLSEDGEIDEWAEAELPLTVQCRQLMLESNRIAPMFPGDSADVQLKATGPNAAQASFRVYAGELPQGLALERSGHLHGVIDPHADPGAYNFVVEINDGEGGYGLAGLAVLVQPPTIPRQVKPEPGTTTCSAASEGTAGLLPIAAALLGVMGLGRRRRMAAARSRS